MATSRTKTNGIMEPSLLAGVAAIAAGALFILIQPLHPSDTLPAVTTDRWQLVHVLSLIMDFLALFGIAGLFAVQARKAGRLGFAGLLLLGTFYALSFAFHFIEAFVYPVLEPGLPAFIGGLQGLVTGEASQISLGAIPGIYAMAGVSYLLGGVLFGIATYRARVLPRRAGLLLAIGSALTLLGAVIPHPFDRIMAVPVGVALAWMGWALLAGKK